MLRSPKVFLCAPRIMRSDFDKLNCDNIIDVIKNKYLRDAGRQECTIKGSSYTSWLLFNDSHPRL